jgi:hypothetical protein
MAKTDDINETAEKKDVGYFLPGVWGCPPALKVP